VAIIGMGCMFPQAEDLARYWANIRRGCDAITEVPISHWQVADYFDQDPKAPDRTYAHRGGFLTPVDFPLLDFGIAPHSVEATDTTQLLGLLVARAALENAGCLAQESLDHDRVSVILGVTGTLELVIPLGARLGHPIWRRALVAAGVDPTTTEDVVARIAASYVGWQENSFPGLLGNVAAGRIANRLDLRGTNCVVDAACASSLGAVNLAMLELAAGRCDLAVTGGIDTFNDIFMYMCFSKTPALSPSGDARPFDADADGTILGEGVGVLVLKRWDDARRDGDRIYAVIRSMGSSSDGKGQSVYAPSALGQARALKRAYEAAEVSPGTVELVEAHGTGTKVGDATELAALEEVFQAAPRGGSWCALGSVKSQVGHTKAAAGAAGLIKAALALYHKVLPPTSKVRRPMERLAVGDSPFYLSAWARPWLPSREHPRRAAVSAFGFGGSNFHCLLEEADPSKPTVDWDGDVQILAYSSDSPAEIAASLESVATLLEWSEIRAQGSLCRGRFRRDHCYRLLLVVERGQGDLKALCSLARARLELISATGNSALKGRPERSRGTDSSGRVFVGMGSAPGQLALLFPGQGSQYVGMLRDLACQFPRMQAALALASEVRGGQGSLLSDRIYPQTTFGETARNEQERLLRDTRIAQPAIGAVSLGLWRILEDFGVRPDLTGGHSFGELTALCASGRIEAESLAILAQRRGELMADCAELGAPGAMLAVFASLDEVSALLCDHGLDLVIANKNTPRQCILSGAAAEVERTKRLFDDRGIATQPVPVSAAFHSRAVAQAEGPLREVLASIKLGASAIPVFANATAEPYPAAPEDARALLAGQLARPVEFVAQIDAMYRMGARTFLEVGPDAKLTGLVGAILQGRDHLALAVDASRGASSNLYDLACSLATLAAVGYGVDLTRWDEGDHTGGTAPRKAGLTVQICGANARPKVSPSAELFEDQKPSRPRPDNLARSEASPRFSLVPENSAAIPAQLQPPDHTEVDWTMKPPERINLYHSNGQGASHDLAPRAAAEKPASMSSAGSPLEVIPAQTTALSAAIQSARDNLMALERLAQQTAALHRQFLEGQEKTQQTFLKLLDREQQLSLALLDSTEQPAPLPESHNNGIGPVPRPVPRPAAPERTEPTLSKCAAAGGQRTAAILIEVVAERTGYPAEVLDLDMQLDTDLGIDSIKRVEILSALQDRMPRLLTLNPEQLGSFRTLRAIADFVGQAHPDREQPATRPDADTPGRHRDHSGEIAQLLLEIVALKTGYPTEMLELDMQLDADLGIDSIKRVEIFSALEDRLPGSHAASAEELGALGTLREIVAFLGRAGSAATANQAGSNGADAPETIAREPVARALLEAVAAKTGYPIDMLELEMRLDTDLGIDSIKRVEILSAVQERLPQAGSISAEQLGTLGTLGQIVESLAAPPCPSPAMAFAPASGQAIEMKNRNGAAERPSENRHPEASHIPLESDLPGTRPTTLKLLYPIIRPLETGDFRQRLDLPAGGTVWVTADGSALTEAVCAAVHARDYGCRVIRLEDVTTPAGDEPPCGLIILAPRESRDETFLKDAFRVIRSAGPPLEQAAARRGSSLLTVSRLDGSFGLRGLAPEICSASGALAGMAKTAGQEWPGVHCKAIDLDFAFDDPAEAAGLIVDELFQRGPVEVGLSRRGRAAVELVSEVTWSAPKRRLVRLERGDMVVISGGARGITAAVALGLAQSFGPRLVLLGRTPAPAAEPVWLADIDGEAQLMRALLERSDGRGSPRELGEEARRLIRQREIRHNLTRIENAGSPVVYRSVDVRDSVAVKAVMAEIGGKYGRVRGLIHGAGVLADRRIVDQTDAQFDLVYGTKVNGLFHLFQSIDPESLSFLILFSSLTGRFGRSGQVAYAAANEALNKWAQQQSQRLTQCRVVSYNWGPWAGGMVQDSLKPLFEREGLSLIPLEAGAHLVVDLIRGGGSGPVEVVVHAEPRATEQEPASPRTDPAVAHAVAQKMETVFRRAVDLEWLPVLASHVIDGHAVLPMAIIMEWMAEAAVHRNPGLVVCGVDDLRIYKGVILGASHETTVELRVGKALRSGLQFIVPVELKGTLASGREVAHARADVVLDERHAAATRELADPELFPCSLSPDEIYRTILFHGPSLQGIEQVDGLGERAIAGWVATAPEPSEWLDQPLRKVWLTDPLAIDCAFQLVVLWCRDRLGANSLPTAIGGYRQFRPRFPAQGVRIMAEIRQATSTRALADIEFLDANGELVARLGSYECVVDSSLNQAFRRNKLAPEFTLSRAE